MRFGIFWSFGISFFLRFRLGMSFRVGELVVIVLGFRVFFSVFVIFVFV